MINLNPTIVWFLGFIIGCFIGFVLYAFYCGRKYIEIIINNQDKIKKDDTKEIKLRKLKDQLQEIRYS